MESENIENEPPTAEVEGANRGFRVKNVSEINASSLNGTDANSNKRKFSAPNEETEENEAGASEAKRVNNDGGICKGVTVDIDIDVKGSMGIVHLTNQKTGIVTIKVERERSNDEPSCSNGSVSNGETKIKVEKSAASSTTRESCKFGIRCYKQANDHRQEEAHPGDADYRRPTFPPPPPGTPPCIYGISCYRRNPAHFREYSHPSDNLYIPHIPHNIVTLQNNLNQVAQPPVDEEDETSDFEDDFDEPFSDDGEAYEPSEDEFSGDYDDCDRVEE